MKNALRITGLIILISIGCTNQSIDESTKLLAVDIDSIGKKVIPTKLSEIVESFKVVRLENHDEAYLGRGNRFAVSENYIIQRRVGKVLAQESLFKNL